MSLLAQFESSVHDIKMHTQSDSKPEWLKIVEKVNREQTLRCLKSFGSLPGAKVAEDQDKEIVPGHWMASIVVQGSGIRMILKAYSNSRGIDALIAKTMKLQQEDLHGTQFSDFLREVCSLSAGMIKSELAKSGLELANSLPISTRGVDTVFFQTSAGSRSVFDRWLLQWDGGRVTFEANVDVINEDSLKVFKVQDSSSDETDLFEELLK